MSKRQQKTLAAFGFKIVMHRGEEINVYIPNKIDLEDHFKLKCLYCSLALRRQQGLSLHMICKYER